MVSSGFGTGGFGGSSFGSPPPPFGVAGATAVDALHVEVFFTTEIDHTFPPIFDPANYVIPSLSVLSVEEAGLAAVILTTSPQSNITYTATVAAARSVGGLFLDPSQKTATFAGVLSNNSFFAVATGATRVRVVFAQPMLNDGSLTDPSNYTITDLNGTSIPVLSAVLEQAGSLTQLVRALSVLLTLGSSLVETVFYVSTVSSNLHTTQGYEVTPKTSVFQWLQGTNQFQVPLGMFTGEVSGGLFGNPDGLVFFSPALDAPAANSIIQVQEVDVCTTAFDTYVMPAPVDPLPLFLHGGGLVPTPNPDPYLLNQTVLWAPWPRNFEAKFELGFPGASNQEELPPPVDNSCSVLMQQQFALGYVALLNDPAWFLFDNKHGTSVPPTFITAKNLAPIPPGPETIMVLHVEMDGKSSFPPATAKKTGTLASTMAGTSKLVAGAGPPAVVLADASLSAGASLHASLSEKRAALAAIQGVSTVSALAVEGNPLPTVIFASSSVSAFGTVRRAVAASLAAGSSVSANATVTRGAVATLAGGSQAVPGATAKWAGHATVAGGSTIIHDASVTHKSQAIIVGGAVLTATSS